MLDEQKEAAKRMNEIATGPFSIIYEPLGKRLVEKSGITKGLCIDIGCGAGQLGIAIAKNTNMNIIAHDINPFALDYTMRNALEENVGSRCSTLCSNVESIPLEDESIDLCVSRGSFWFWEDGKKAFSEIYRILKKGSKAYIGCSFVNEEILEEVIKRMEVNNPGWKEERIKMFNDHPVSKFKGFLKDAGIKNYEINDYPYERIIIINK